jgi:protein CpxP
MIRLIRSKVVLGSAAAAVIVILATSVAAQQGEGRGGWHGRRFGFGGPGRGGFPLAQLGLTEAQREQVRDVMQRHRGEMREVGERLRAAHDAQRNAVETVPVNEGLIRSTSQAMATAQTDMALLRARIHNEVWNLLTPEQQAKAKELKAQREIRAKERLERRQQRRQQQG